MSHAQRSRHPRLSPELRRARPSSAVIAAHYTSVRGRLRATAVETVLLDAPARLDFGWCAVRCRMSSLHTVKHEAERRTS